MTHDARQQPGVRCAELVAVQVEIGAADTDRFDAHDGLTGLGWRRVGPLLQQHRAAGRGDGDSHDAAAGASVRKAITSSATRSGSSK